MDGERETIDGSPAMPYDVPVLETDRLVMRGHRPDDLADSALMWADPNVTRFIGGRPLSREEVWVKLLRNIGHWSLFGQVSGSCARRRRTSSSEKWGSPNSSVTSSLRFEGTPEIGWVVAPRAHNRGFATEAVRAALAWFEAEFGRVQTVCLIDPGNAPSLRVAAKCGYVERVRTTLRGQPTVVLER